MTLGYEGRWSWSVRDRKLSIRTESGAAISDLKGTWTLDGLSALLDGFSRKRLQLALNGSEVSVNCELNLSDRRHVQLVGAFMSEEGAQGLLLCGPEARRAAGEQDGPGPTLQPVYQPIVSVEGRHVCGFEALARWEAGPGDIQTGQRYDDDGLASNMLIQACEALAGWRAASGRRDLFVHVNLTGRDLELEGLVDLVQALIEGFSLPRHALRIELTEQAALRDSRAALQAAHRLKAAGAGLVLDDFGSGHSSFSWLADLPADGLKIDLDLTRRLGEPRTDAILRAVTRLAGELGMTVTGEGIEADWQLDAIAALGMDYAQGFALSHPLTETAVLAVLGASGNGLQTA